jgi:cysteinyl-tRNA synthetase
MHAEHLNDSTGKMSKSKGEFLTVSLLESKGYNPLAYRFMCLQSHYRKQLVFTYESLDVASSAYDKLRSRVQSLGTDGELNKETDEYKIRFKESLEDDLNTSTALTTLFDMLKDSLLSDKSKRYLVEDFDKVLSLDLLKEEKLEIDDEMKIEIEALIKERNDAKANKDYTKADEIRDKLNKMGIIIKDSREGTTYELERGI